MLDVLTMHPIATFSALAMYVVLILLAFPKIRDDWMPPAKGGPGKSMSHFGGFDAYRGLAALFVAVGHMWYFTYPHFAASQLAWRPLEFGAAAVPIFCVLSGFLIFRSVSSIKTFADLGAYGLRRLFRIYPVYLLGVMIGLVMGLYGSGYDGMRTFFAEAFMFHILWWPGFVNPVAWSLYHEVMFYLFLPVVVAMATPKRMIWVASLGVIFMLLGDDSTRTFGLWRFFLLGIIASELTEKVARWAVPVFVVGLALVAYDLREVPEMTDWVAHIGIAIPRYDRETMGLGIGFALMLMATPHMPRLGQALDVYPLRLLGLVSYSLYILHPFYIMLTFPGMQGWVQNPPFFEQFGSMPAWYLPFVYLPGVVFWAVVAYFVVEKRGIEYGKRLARRRSPAMVPTETSEVLAARDECNYGDVRQQGNRRGDPVHRFAEWR